MSPDERKAMINRDRTDLSLTKQCKRLKISRSSLYYRPVGVNAETLKLMHEIDRVFTKYPFFGSRQIAAYLPRNGFLAGRHRVRRLIDLPPEAPSVRRQGFWHQWQLNLRESLAHLVGCIMRRVVCDASVAFRASFV